MIESLRDAKVTILLHLEDGESLSCSCCGYTALPPDEIYVYLDRKGLDMTCCLKCANKETEQETYEVDE